jgi:dihydrofolate reductase
MAAIVVAVAHDNVIGKSNSLPWYLPADLRHFKEVTTDGTVIMGRKTYESIVERLGKALPNRRNIVVTRSEHSAPDAEFVNSIEKALQLAADDEDVFIIGGAQIYEQALPLADTIYLTEVDADIDGDTFFPTLDENEWQEVARESHKKDDKNEYDYAFVTLQKVK